MILGYSWLKPKWDLPEKKHKRPRVDRGFLDVNIAH